MERISGVPAARVLGRVAFEVFPFLAETGEDAVFRRVLGGQSVANHERPYRVPESGRAGFFEGSYFPVRDAGGAVTGGMAIIREVSERRRGESERAELVREVAARRAAEAASARFAFLAEASTLLAASLDYATTLQRVAELAVPRLADWCLVHVLEGEDTLREMASAHVDPAKAELARQLHRSRAIDPERNAISRVLRTGRAELVPEVSEAQLTAAVREKKDLDLLRRLGPTSYMVVPIATRGRIIGALSFVATVSRRRFGPADLALAEDLAHRAGFAIDNARLYHELEELDRRKDEFLAMLGHELRNPLGAIRTALQVVDHAGTPSDEATRQRAIIDRQMRHLARLVDDLLDVSRVLSGRIVLESQRVDLNEVARQCLLALQRDARAQDHDLSLSVHAAPLEILGDAVRLEQIVVNLVENALKYTPAGGTVEIRVAREDGHGVIRVRDSGIGIDPEVLPRIFDLFMQADASLVRSSGDLGLGLTLVRRMVELHGGKVSARSEGPGQGSEFVVSLPLLVAPLEAVAVDHEAPAPAPSRRVLVIEDNRDARDALRALLTMWGHRVEVAEDGPRGFEMALANHPDVVVVDIGLPGLDGYHVAHGLRTALGDVFLIALTGYGQPDDRRRALEAGFDLHLVKPVDPQALADALATAPAHES